MLYGCFVFVKEKNKKRLARKLNSELVLIACIAYIFILWNLIGLK